MARNTENLTIEQTLAAMNDSTIMNQFASLTGLDKQMDPTNLSLPTAAMIDLNNHQTSSFLPPAPGV